MTAFVTGGTGFLGQRLVRILREQGQTVRCLVRGTSDLRKLEAYVGAALWSGVTPVVADLMDTAGMVQQFKGCQTLYHVASAPTGSTAVMFLNNVVPTRSLMDAAVLAGIKRLVHVSSLGVYGAAGLAPGAVLDESTPVDASPHLRDPYTYSKVAQEAIVWEAHHAGRLPVVIVRPGVIFGPGRGVLSARLGLKVGPLWVRMGGRQTLPYTFVENCAAAIYRAGVTPGVEGQAFNILDDNLPTANRLIKMYRRSGHKLRSVWVPRPCIRPISGMYEWYHNWSQGQLPGVITRYKSASMWTPLRYTNQKAKTELNWQPAVSFEEAFARSLVKDSTAGDA